MKQGTQVELGKKYRDIVLDIEGIATGQARYITGCDHVQLEWVKDGENKLQWFDILRLKPVKSVAAKLGGGNKTGGPASHPPGRGPG